MLALGLSQAEAAYRLTFQNGTSVEVQSYEDLGDAIRYPRLGGVVVVPKSIVSAIEEAVHLPPPTPSASTPRAPSAVSPNVIQGFQETSRPPVNPPVSSPPVVARPAPIQSAPGSPIGPFTMISGALKVIGGFIIFILAVSGFLFWFRFSGKFAEKADSLPYAKRPSLLTAAERSFYGVLCQALDHRYSIFAKVRLGDLLEISWGTQKFRSYLNRINCKHVDFVLCDSTSFTPLLVIELDDSSHEREDRQERDAFVDAALDAAGLPILHVSVQHAYASADLRVQIYGHLNAGAQAEVTV
jgi:very-short-patch-repair endonuclease